MTLTTKTHDVRNLGDEPVDDPALAGLPVSAALPFTGEPTYEAEADDEPVTLGRIIYRIAVDSGTPIGDLLALPLWQFDALVGEWIDDARRTSRRLARA